MLVALAHHVGLDSLQPAEGVQSGETAKCKCIDHFAYNV